MIDDDDYFGGRPSRREVAIERDRAYGAGRRRGRRIARRDVDADLVEDDRERSLLFGGGGRFGGLAGGFGMGSSGAALVIIGLLLMAMAYFGMGFDGGYGGGYTPYDSGGGYTPELPPQGLGEAYGGGGDLMSQRPMMFMGGGFLFMTGWLLVIASRLRALLTDDL